MAAPRLLAVLVLVPALALSACGTTGKDSAKNFQGEQRAVAQAIEDLQTAGRKGDQDKICEQLLAPALVQKITAANGPCPNALKDRIADADVFELQVQKVTIDGDRATAVVKTDGGDPDQTYSLGLQKVGGSWKLSSLG
jgi:hypothetical protein